MVPSVVTARSPVPSTWECMQEADCMYSSLSSSLSVRVAASSIATRRTFHGAFQGQEHFMTRRHGEPHVVRVYVDYTRGAGVV